MNPVDDPAPGDGSLPEATAATGGARCPLGYPNGLSKGVALAQGGEGTSSVPRAGARGERTSLRHQGAPETEETATVADPEPPLASRQPAFPDRRPRRRTYQPSHREDIIAARFTPDEKAEIVAAAKRTAVFPSGFLATAGLNAARGAVAVHRDAQLDDAIDELAALRAQISRVGNNINQIAHVYNAGGRPRPGELAHALTVLVRTLLHVDAAADTLAGRRTR
ncbi:plasmid mobilization protein [Streptomyces aidingensis]|uniref:Mobilisation protein (MobC) n=1 Tax=Streptomyces aidingensis TaxID=910347 RepID=A0A1I1KEN4_9ACTN|nr:plasmid mobilization relaxosome protein MobC [Streptomyces aidingensis]SFC59269.1 mobilisation protein (MobC) [Streptomyces aidingensis]